MRLLALVSVFLIALATTFSQQKSDSLFLRVVLPDRDTIQVPFSRHRIAASTIPSAKAFLNGMETKVYASGAFVGILPLNVGVNKLRMTVRDAAGDSLFKDFVINRTEPAKTTSHDTLAIDTVMMEPAQDLWLGKDDILEVKFKGSPGYQASFNIEDVESGIRMKELPAKEAGGLGGVYIGRYKIRDIDASKGYPIKFRLKKSFWTSEKAFSKGKVWIMPDSLPRVAEIIGRRPFLNAGLGIDRLGGAKLGFLQSGVLVRVAGKVGQQYRIRLSESMEGWLPQEFARLLPLETPLPHSLTTSISVAGDSLNDIVTVPLAQKLPYLSDQQISPNAIVVDIYGATSNTNWITHQLSAKVIESVKWNQVAADQFRLTILLKERQQWGYDVGYENGGSLRVKIRRPPLIRSKDSVLAGLTVAVDAGHGGDGNGALGATGVLEKDITLLIAKLLRDSLVRHGATVVMTRTGDDAIPMGERTDKVITSGARVLISVHCNSTGETADPLLAQGVSTYYRYIGYRPLATTMYDKMLELGLMQFGVTGSFNFSLNAPTQLPNVLVETAFLSNPEDEMLLIDDGFRKRIAGQITSGLEEFIRTYGEYPK